MLGPIASRGLGRTGMVSGLLSPVGAKSLRFRSLVEVARSSNNFHRHQTSSQYWDLSLEHDKSRTSYGKVHPDTVSEITRRNIQGWGVDRDTRTLTVLGPNSNARSSVFNGTWAALRSEATLDRFATLLIPRNEPEVVYDHSGKEAFRCERSMCLMFGLPGHGMMATIYYRALNGQYRFAVARRSATKPDYAGMLDVPVGGCVSTDRNGNAMTAIRTLFQEGDEEASLPESVIREHASLRSIMSYQNIRDVPAALGQEHPDYFVYNAVNTCFSIEVNEEIALIPKDQEVQYFQWMSSEELMEVLLRGEMKPNSALAFIDTLLKLGLLRDLPDNELRELFELAYGSPAFPLPTDVKSSLASLGYEHVCDQRA